MLDVTRELRPEYKYVNCPFAPEIDNANTRFGQERPS